ncbi:MAG: hypothetical protein K6A36_07330 [Paludibacteraceae bacterium]|nr:hypothetical protein [Paludibacteraceae bacterium]
MRNSAWLLLSYSIGWLVWLSMNWESISSVQRLLAGMFVLLAAHEIEETYQDRFVAMMGRVVGFDPEKLPMQGIIHLPADIGIGVLMTLSIVYSDRIWLVLPVFMLGIVEMIVHNTCIAAFRLKSLSSGWYSAMLQGIYSIYALVLICRFVAIDRNDWLLGALLLACCFGMLEVWILWVTGKLTKWQKK